MPKKTAPRSLAEALEDDRRQLIETLRGHLGQFQRYYRLTNPAASELRSRLNAEIQRAYPAEFNLYLDRTVGQVTHVRRGLRPMSLDEIASLYRASKITFRDLLLEQRDTWVRRLADMSLELTPADVKLSRQLGPTTAADVAKRAALAHSASWQALPRREREAARLFARHIETNPFSVGAGRPRYAGETTVLEVALAIRAALAESGRVRLSDRRLIPFNKVGSTLKGKAMDLLRAAVLAALPVTGLPTDSYLRTRLTRHR